MKIFWMMAVLAGACFGQATTGRITGVLRNDEGRTLASAPVLAVLEPAAPPPANFRPFSTAVRTGATGAFELAGLPAGRYKLCPQIPGSEYVDPCYWEKGLLFATVTAGGTAVQDLVLERGQFVNIQLRDQEGFLGRHEGKTPGGHLLVGVTVPVGLIREAELVHDVSNGVRRYRVLVPLNVKFRYRVVSALFDVENDDARQPVAVLQDLVQEVKDRSPKADVVLRVRGIKAQ